MIDILIPGFRHLELHHLVSDYNGTLAVDGILLPGVEALLKQLSERLEIHVITADTFGFAGTQLDSLPVKLKIIPLELQAEAKLAYVQELGAEKVSALGNGRNDRMMLKAAALGIALIQGEGAATDALVNAHVVSSHAVDALNLLVHSKRLIATLRS